MDHISISVLFLDLTSSDSWWNVFGLWLWHADTQLENSKNWNKTNKISPFWANQALSETSLLRILCLLVKPVDKPWNGCTLLESGWPWGPTACLCVPPEVWDHLANNCLGKKKWVTGSCFTTPLILHLYVHNSWLYSLQQLVEPQVGSIGQQPLDIAWSTHCLRLAGKGVLLSNRNVDWVPARHSSI